MQRKVETEVGSVCTVVPFALKVCVGPCAPLGEAAVPLETVQSEAMGWEAKRPRSNGSEHWMVVRPGRRRGFPVEIEGSPPMRTGES